jgi:ABC-type transporter Mla subunit MlaD
MDMAAKHRNELLAGAVVLAALGVALAIVLWLGATDFLRRPAQVAYFCAEPAKGPVGLMEGSTVVINDKPIGKIIEVRPRAGAPTLYVAQIHDAQFTVHADATASPTKGLLGASSLAITSLGTRAAGMADEAHPVALPGGTSDAMEAIASAASRLNEGVGQLNTMLTRELDLRNDASLLRKVHASLDEVRQASASLNQGIAALSGETQRKPDTLVGKLHGSLDAVGRISGNLDGMVAEARPKVDRTLTAVEGMAVSVEQYSRKDVADLLKGLRDVNSKVLRVMGDFEEISSQTRQIMAGNRPLIDEAVDNLTQVSADLKATAKEVRRAPWRLLYTPKPGEVQSQNLFDAARNFSSGAEQLDQALTKLTALSRSATQPADDAELKAIREKLRDSFENFSKVEQTLWNEIAK